ncbi:LysR family transcriptional regulator [Salipiger marinus]|jgi:DNA-binding transcriptional LysR family regulator|uniref:DNA-binding transcriptional regulator, LysR family n=2 Tax=Salipiger marinus TaxID=555512 RepID=A0A1G8RJV3_9RHOB|nr:LysR substrate-binding domain-containing protein [Salipiger marinus]SDJ16785.1 DNA-binding transcriptional regulator, LysR family [Salipiger marinus]
MGASIIADMLNLRQLEILRAVVQYRTTVGAAERLGMSQPSISNTIRHIETVLGFPLFERVSNRLAPTEEALILLEESEPLFLLRDAVNQRAADLRAGRIGRIRVASTAEISEAVLPRVIADYARDYPRIQISLETRPLDSVLQVVENGVADVAFVIAAYERQALHYELVHDLRAVCLCDEADPLARLEVVTPKDLAERPMVGPQVANRIGLMFADSFRANGLDYRPSIETRFMNAAARIVREGWGVALVDELSAFTAMRPGLVVRPYGPDLRFDLSAALPRTKTPSRQTQRFIKAFRDRVVTRIAEVRAASQRPQG